MGSVYPMYKQGSTQTPADPASVTWCLEIDQNSINRKNIYAILPAPMFYFKKEHFQKKMRFLEYPGPDLS